MIIPKKIKIMGRTIKVVLESELTNQNDVTGEARYRYDTIAIQDNVKGKPRSEQDMEITFLHEVLHHIAHRYEIKQLEDEKIISLLSEALYQVFSPILKANEEKK